MSGKPLTFLEALERLCLFVCLFQFLGMSAFLDSWLQHFNFAFLFTYLSAVKYPSGFLQARTLVIIFRVYLLKKTKIDLSLLASSRSMSLLTDEQFSGSWDYDIVMGQRWEPVYSAFHPAKDPREENAN